MKEIYKWIQKNSHIKNLFLDPNNYRFIDNKLFDKTIQNRTYVFLEKEGLKDLEDSFKKNGYLPVDIIQVAKKGDKFLVIEGTAILTLKKNKKLQKETSYYKDYKIL